MDFYTDYYKLKRGPSLVRLLNVSPSVGPLDIYADAVMLEHSIHYGEITEYRSLPSGNHIIRAFIAGKKEGALENRSVSLAPDEVYTFAMGDLEKTGLLVVPEPDIKPPYGKAFIRIVNLSPKAAPIDIILPCGTELFKNVQYGEITDYVAVDTSLNTLFVGKSHSDDPIIYKAEDIDLEPGGVYTGYTAGLLSSAPKFRLFLTQDGDPSEC